MQTITAPQCFHCHQSSRLEITDEEASSIAQGVPIHEALPTVDRATRETFISGIHPTCWTELFGPAPDTGEGESGT